MSYGVASVPFALRRSEAYGSCVLLSLGHARAFVVSVWCSREKNLPPDSQVQNPAPSPCVGDQSATRLPQGFHRPTVGGRGGVRCPLRPAHIFHPPLRFSGGNAPGTARPTPHSTSSAKAYRTGDHPV